MRLSVMAAAAACLLSIQSEAMVGGDAPPLDESPTKSVVFIAFGEGGRCTGAVIAKRLILTAAHCMENPLRDYKIIFSNDITKLLKREARADVRYVTQAYFPPTIEKIDPLSDDAVILELASDAPADVEIARLPDHDLALGAGTKITSYGFGLQNPRGIEMAPVPASEGISWEPVNLKRRELVTSTPERARFKGIQLDYHRLFVAQPEGGICLGDSGGPAFIEDDGQRLLIAVNGATVPEFNPPKDGHSAPRCAANAYLTRIDTLADWIQSVIKDHGAMPNAI